MRIKIIAKLIKWFVPKAQDTESLMPILKAVDKCLEAGLELAVYSYNSDYDELAEQYQYTAENEESTERVLN